MTDDTSTGPTATFHAGEQALQAQVGARERLAEIGPLVIRDHMPEQHRAFFAQLPFLIVGSLDAQGQPWASVLAAPVGFLQTPDAQHLHVAARPDAADPLHGALAEGAALGLLGIEPHSRRRNRMNGRVASADERGFTVAVSQSFGNCPKYIHVRRAEPVGRVAGPPQRMDVLDAAARAMIANADTFFVASAHPHTAPGSARAEGVDVSHRGGPAGFVRIDGDVLTVPDYAGNRFFNTLGNLMLAPQAGLLFVDFETGDLLQVAARAELVLDGPELATFEGAERLLKLQVMSALRRPAALPLAWADAV